MPRRTRLGARARGQKARFSAAADGEGTSGAWPVRPAQIAGHRTSHAPLTPYNAGATCISTEAA